MEGVASIALLPNGSISGHFIHLPHSTCYGLHGTGNQLIHNCFYANFHVLKLLRFFFWCSKGCFWMNSLISVENYD
jgi:hypothetical protein